MSSPHESPDSGPAQASDDSAFRRGTGLRRRLGVTGWTRTRAVLSLGMVFGLGAVGTMAAWSDTATATTGMFTTSTVNVEMSLDGQRPTLAFTSLNKVDLGRGAGTAGMLPVQNTGGADFTYTAKAVTADAGTASYGDADAASFARSLTVAVFAGGSSTGTACTGGTPIVSKPLAVGGVDLITDARRVDVAAADDLCFQVTVAADAPVSARMSALSVDFRFAATQA